jgi:hypothetical protein
MATVTDETSGRAGRVSAKADNGMLLVDLGKKSRKQIKRFRRGEGKLVDEVQRCMHELKSAGTVSESSQPVVIVVREKPRRFDWF